MIKEKGILNKLLFVVGAVLVTMGVFAFQGASLADDTTAPNEGNDIGLTTGELASGDGAESTATGEPDGTGEPDDTGEPTTPAESGDSEEPGATEEPAQDVPANYTYTVKYYNDTSDAEDNLLLTDTFADTEEEHTFKVTDLIPEGDGNFLAWYDVEAEKYYTAADEITLTAEKPELVLVAKFAVLRHYLLVYDANGGANGPTVSACESYLSTCDFVVSDVVPTREGFEFKGWQKEGDDTVVYTPGTSIRSRSTTEPLVLKAVWAEVRSYVLIYEGNGGTGTPEVQVCKSSTGACSFVVSDITPSRPGFLFLDWQNGETSVGSNSEIFVNESVTILVANWNPIITFTLEYVADDAENIPEPEKCETAMGTCTFIIPDKEPTRESYIFRGWRFEDQEDMLAKAGDELIVSVDNSTNIRVIAVWSRIYTILNSGEVFGAGERVVLRSPAEFDKFVSLEIDSESVPEDYFTVTEGGATSIILTNAFAQSLSAGEHAFKITWNDGEATGIISVNQSEDGTKRFVIVDATGTVDGAGLMYRPKAGAVSKESSGVVADSATDNNESNFDAVRTLILVAVAAFVVVYIVNRFYVRHKMDFIENF